MKSRYIFAYKQTNTETGSKLSKRLLSIVFILSLQPAVAVGNVGQLAVDLMVSTLNMSRVGFIHTDCLIPMAGNNPYATCKEDAEELHTPAEGISLGFHDLAAEN